MLTLDNWIKQNDLEGLQDEIKTHVEELTTCPDPSAVRCIMISIRQRFKDVLDQAATEKLINEATITTLKSQGKIPQ